MAWAENRTGPITLFYPTVPLLFPIKPRFAHIGSVSPSFFIPFLLFFDFLISH